MLLDDVAPPSTKKETAQARGQIDGDKIAQVDLKRAVRSGQDAIYKQRTKETAIRKNFEKVDNNLRAHRNKRKEKEEVLNTLRQIISGQKPVIVEQDILDRATPTIKEFLENQEIIFKPTAQQTEFLAAAEKEVFYGGARGGGKSYAILVDPLRYCDRRSHRALILRRTMPELRDMISHSQHLYGRAFPGAKWREQEKEWKFPSGARIEFGYAENLQDALRYQGQSYTWIGVDELPQYPDASVWNFLRSSLRSIDPEIPTYMRATGNPGNIGSLWVKETFINPAPPNTSFVIDIETPLGKRSITRRFIPAKLTDNPYLMYSEDYLITLSSLPDILRQQWLEGNWDVFDNAAFPEFDKSIHVINPFEIPRNWTRFRACDWGYSSNGCVLWFVVDFDGRLIVYRELYFKGKNPDQLAEIVLGLEENDPKPMRGFIDGSTDAKRGDRGPSIFETLNRQGCRWTKADQSPRSRINGKLEIHRRLAKTILNKNGNYEPALQIFSTCRNLIRTLPALPLDKNNQEDVDTNAEDHAYDALRYGCMSRPRNPADILADFGKITERTWRPADPILGY